MKKPTVAPIKPERTTPDAATVAKYHELVDRLVAKGAMSLVIYAETYDGFECLSEPDLMAVRLGMHGIFDSHAAAASGE